MSTPIIIDISNLFFKDIRSGDCSSVIASETLKPFQLMPFTFREFTLTTGEGGKLRKTYTGREFYGRVTSIHQRMVQGLEPGHVLMHFVKQ